MSSFPDESHGAAAALLFACLPGQIQYTLSRIFAGGRTVATSSLQDRGLFTFVRERTKRARLCTPAAMVRNAASPFHQLRSAAIHRDGNSAHEITARSGESKYLKWLRPFTGTTAIPPPSYKIELIDPSPEVVYFLERSVLFLRWIHRLAGPPGEFLHRFAREAFIDGAAGQQVQPATPTPAGIPCSCQESLCVYFLSRKRTRKGDSLSLAEEYASVCQRLRTLVGGE